MDEPKKESKKEVHEKKDKHKEKQHEVKRVPSSSGDELRYAAQFHFIFQNSSL